ncbi:MAG TPA: class III extradiol ring-cleavage dioxygenase [Dongiaceae bacterium]|nr:class III extradiol ring-cleavage dioxygenase [Dongiaceae bacterium]
MSRLPSLYITHGGGPCFWMEFGPPFGPHAFDKLRAYLAGLIDSLPERPKAILVVSGHWEEDRPTVSTAARPGMLFDYYGFPPHTYQLSYPAPGAPDLAQHVRGLLQAAGIDCGTDDKRGFDHGVFVPQLIIDPKAEIPVVMLSMRHDLDPAAHIAIGKALAPLRDEGVLIVGSGSSYHNLRQFFTGDGRASVPFDDWLAETATEPDADRRNARLVGWEKAPNARLCHPREDHLIPLMVAAGAAGADVGRHSFHDRIGGQAISCFSFGG